MWPTTVSHRIDVSSPLYGFSPEQLADSRVEVIDLIEFAPVFASAFAFVFVSVFI